MLHVDNNVVLCDDNVVSTDVHSCWVPYKVLHICRALLHIIRSLVFDRVLWDIKWGVYH